MKTKRSLFLLFALFTFCLYAQGPQIAKVDIELLKGDQPALLKAMASSASVKEGLNGSKMDAISVVAGWHAQAVAQYKDYIYVALSTGDRTGRKLPSSKDKKYPSKLWIYNTKTQQGEIKDLDNGYPHPCSIQVTGKYLAIVVEAEYGLSQAALNTSREERSMVLIFDLEQDPKCSVEVARVVQDGKNSGGAGLTYSPQTRCWYLLVDQDYSKGRVVVYKTANQNIDSWQKEPIAQYQRFGSGAGLNLITASDNSIWGLWYDANTELPAFSQFELSGDQVFLFKLIEPNGTPVSERAVYSQIVNLLSPRLKGAGELLAASPGMRFGATLRNENGNLEVLTCQRNMASTFNIGRTKISTDPRSQVVFVNLAKTKGEIKATGGSQSFSKQGITLDSFSSVLPSPVNCSLNYLPISTKSFGSLKLPKWTNASKHQSSAPLILVYLQDSGGVKGNMEEFNAKKQTDKKLN